ncbi:MAG: hypothetical protein QXK24_08885, partial [Ignisphaera sp.]
WVMAEEEFPIPEEMLETPIEKLIAKKAEELYKAETGLDWKENPPDEHLAKEYVRRAGKQILARWLSSIRQIKTATESIFGKPPKRVMILVKHDRKVEMLPIDEILEPGKIPITATLQCPKCGQIAMKTLVPGIWQCSNCYYTINTLTWFPKRKRI